MFLFLWCGGPEVFSKDVNVAILLMASCTKSFGCVRSVILIGLIAIISANMLAKTVCSLRESTLGGFSGQMGNIKDSRS